MQCWPSATKDDMQLSFYLRDEVEALHVDIVTTTSEMKGTEVPNPQRSSAWDCT